MESIENKKKLWILRLKAKFIRVVKPDKIISLHLYSGKLAGKPVKILNFASVKLNPFLKS